MNGQGVSGWLTYLPFLALFAFMYLFLIRPQQVQQRKRREMLSSLRPGAKVVTLGGIFGTITDLKDDRVTLNIAEGVSVQMAIQAIANVVAE